MADDILFNVKGDSSSAIDATQSLIESLNNLDSAINKIGESLGVFQELADALDNVYSAANLATSGIEAFGLQVDDSFTLLKDSISSIDAFNSSINSLNADTAIAAVDNLANAIADLSDIATIALDDLQKLGVAGQQSAADMSPLTSAAQQVASSAQQVSTSSQQAASALADEATAAQDLAAQLQALDTEEQTDAQDIKDVSASLTEALDSTDALTKASQDLEQAFNNLLNQIEEATLGLQDLGQQALTAASAEEDATAAMDNMSRSMGAMNSAWASTATVSAAATTGMVGFGTAATEAEAKAAGLTEMFGPDSMNLIMMASAITMAGGAFVQMGMQAEDAIAHITGLADQSLSLAKNSDVLNTYIQQLSKSASQYGVTLGDAANGLYNIISAGFPTADALKVLDASMQAAAATGTKMDEVSNALTTILNAYALKGDQAAQVTDKMVEAVVQGKQQFAPFANAIGTVAASADHAGVSISEMLAAEAELTRTNSRVRQDAQELAHLFNTLSNSGQKIVDTANSMGAKLSYAGFESMSLMEKLQTLAKIAKGDTTPAFRQLLQDATSTTTAFNLLRNGGKDYIDILTQIQKSMGATATAFQQTSDTITFQLQRVQADISILSYEFVTFIGPIVAPMLTAIADAVKNLALNFDNLKPIVAAIVAALGTLLVGAIVALTGFMLTLSPPITAVAIAIGAITGAFTLLQPHLQTILQWIQAYFPNLSTLYNTLRQVGDYIGGVLITAWANLQVALSNFVLWLNINVTPHVVDIVNIMLDWANKLASNIIPALDKFIKNTLIPFGNTLTKDVLPPLTKFINQLLQLTEDALGHPTQTLQKIIDVLKKVGEGLAIAGGLFGGFRLAVAVVAAGGIMEFLKNAAAPLIEFLVTKLPAALGGLAPLWAAITSPIGLVIIAIVALIGYFIALSVESKQLQKVWETLKGPLSDVWEAIKGAVKDVVDSFNQNLAPAFKDVMKAAEPLLPVLKALAIIVGVTLIAAIGILIEGLAGLITIIGKAIAGVIQTFAALLLLGKDIIKFVIDLTMALVAFGQKSKDQDKLWKQVWEDMKNIVGDVGYAIQGLWNATLGAIIDGTTKFVQNVVKFFMDLANTLVGHSIVPDMLNKMIQLFKDFPGRVLQVLQQWVQDVIQWFTKLADELVGHSIVPDMIDKIVQLFKDLPDKAMQAIDQFVQSVIQSIGQLAQQMVQSMQQGIQGFIQSISQGMQNAVQAVQQGLQNIAKPFQQIAQSAMQWGKDMINGFAQGIMGAMGGLLSSVQSMAASIASYLHFSKPDVGPLANVDQWMPDFGDTLASGLNAQVSKVGNAARNVAVSISGATPKLNGFSGVNTSNSEQTMILKQILLELRSGNQAAASRGTIGYRIPSTELGAINQQFNSYNTNAQAATLYNQINTLGGLAQEYALRGARTGLGF